MVGRLTRVAARPPLSINRGDHKRSGNTEQSSESQALLCWNHIFALRFGENPLCPNCSLSNSLLLWRSQVTRRSSKRPLLLATKTRSEIQKRDHGNQRLAFGSAWS